MSDNTPEQEPGWWIMVKLVLMFAVPSGALYLLKLSLG